MCIRDSSDTCHAHPTQPLVLYCETCKKQLCRDCVLTTQDHASHKCGFFKEVAPRYRKKLLGELSLIKSQEHSISNALREIEATEKSVASNAVKCQDDIDQAFEEISSVLQECKQAMKVQTDESSSSLTDTFECQKKCLKEVQSEIKDAVISVNTSIKDDDQNFLRKLESTMMRIKSLKEKLQTAPLTVTKPQLLTTHVVSAETLQCYMMTKCYLHNLAYPEMCTVEETSLELQVDCQKTFILNLNDSKGNICQGKCNVEVDLVSLQGSSINRGKIEPVSAGRVKIILIPQGRGQHKLNVKVNGTHIKSSPFPVMVSMPPNMLSEPVATIPGLERPLSLIYSQGMVIATEMNQNRIIEIDSQHHKIQELRQFIGVYEVTQDAGLNFYVTTRKDHKLHKLSNDGRIMKTIGCHGTKKAEFDFPSGLRVSKNCELYVCDSDNNRIQVFDLDLNFKRLFGKKGTGKGQFDFPTDVDFDSNGRIYIADSHNNRIQVLSSSEHHISTIGNQKHGLKLGYPTSLLMHDNHIYVTNYSEHNVVVIKMTGEIITTFGDECLSHPEGITVDKDGFIYVTSHESKIIVF